MTTQRAYFRDPFGTFEGKIEWYQRAPFQSSPTFDAIQTLGKGKFSTVCKVNCHGREWAVKQAFGELETRLLKREALLLKSLNEKEKQNQEFIVQAIGLLTLQDNPMLLLKFYKGGDLLNRISKMEGGLSLAATSKIAEQLLGALVFLKEEKIVHRDIKLPNIFYEPESDKITLGDFGLSMKEENTKESSILCGTPLSMSPELLKAHLSPDNRYYIDGVFRYPYGSHTDVWAAGCVLFQVFSGCQLFSDVHSLSGLQFQQQKLPSRLESLFYQISRKKYLRELNELSFFNTALKGMLELDPKKRITPEEGLSWLSGNEPFVIIGTEDVPFEPSQEEDIELKRVEDNPKARESFVLIEKDDLDLAHPQTDKTVLEGISNIQEDSDSFVWVPSKEERGFEPNPPQDNSSIINVVIGFFQSIAAGASRWLEG